MNEVIPEDAVEVAADLIVQGDMGGCECRRSPFDKHDVNPPCSTRRQAIRVARKILEAAAPYMFAQALEEAVHAFPLETIHAPDNAVVWMMRRAEELRSKL